jgi:hypothetical protein
MESDEEGRAPLDVGDDFDIDESEDEDLDDGQQDDEDMDDDQDDDV